MNALTISLLSKSLNRILSLSAYNASNTDGKVALYRAHTKSRHLGENLLSVLTSRKLKASKFISIIVVLLCNVHRR